MSCRFESESDIVERRRVRQEIWDKTKNEEDPDEAPEEPIPDHRTLFEKLQEQKDKKQEEYDEVHKLKNMVRGLENEEVDFLDKIDHSRKQQEKRIEDENNAALEEYRKKVNERNLKAHETEVLVELKPEAKKSSSTPKKSTQSLLLSGAIKRKSRDDPEENSPKAKRSEKTDENCSKSADDPSVLQCVAVLPGLGEYSDSSDSENETGSDSDLEEVTKPGQLRDLTGRTIHFQCQGRKDCC